MLCLFCFCVWFGLLAASSVREVAWSDPSVLLAFREPVVIRSSSVVPRWTFDDVRSKVSDGVKGVMSSAGRTFFYYDKRHAFVAQGVCEMRLDYEINDMSIGDLIDNVVSGHGNFYYSSSLNETSSVLFSEVAQLFPVPHDMTRVNFWMATSGAVSRLHYDAADNIFMQVRGRKKFLLMSPQNGSLHLPLYPVSHPCHRASFVDPTDFDRSRFPLLNSSMFLVADLNEGDVLVLPSFWFHHVITDSASISVNLYVNSSEKTLTARVFQFQLPIKKGWIGVVQSSAVSLMLKLVASEKLSRVKSMLLDRYRLMELGVDDSTCSCAFGRDVVADPFKFCFGENAFTDEELDQMRLAAKEVGLLLNQLPAGVRELVLTDFVEMWILRLVKSDTVSEYLRSCL